MKKNTKKNTKKELLTKLDHRVLAEGEVTGHAHRANSGTLYRDSAGTLLLEPAADTTITHEEHHATPLLDAIASGQMWEVGIVQEFDHAAQEARNVAD